MSIQAMSWVIDHSPTELRGGEYLTMLMIANHLGKTGEAAFPTVATLAEESRMSKQQTFACLKKLEARGMLLIERGGGRGHTSHYRLPGYELWLKRVKGVDCLANAERVKPFDSLGNGKESNELTVSDGSKGSSLNGKRVKSVELKGQVCRSPPTPPYKDKPSLTVKEPSAHAGLMAFHAKHIQGDIPDPGAQGKAAKWLLEHYTPEQCQQTYTEIRSEQWRTTPVTWLTVQKEIGSRLQRAATPVQGLGLSPIGEKILSDNGDEYTVMGADGTPSRRFRTAKGYAAFSGRPLEEVEANWH